MADDPVVKLTGAQEEPVKLTRWASSISDSPTWEKQKQIAQGQRLAPYFIHQRLYTSRNYSPQTRPRHQGETMQQMPNYNQLTPFERKLTEVLPGFSESTVGKALQRFSESWAGKALGYIDVGAEFIERSGGLASQALNASGDPVAMKEFQANLSAAWYAGSLAADMTNLPTFDYDNEGRIAGMSIPDALPGAAGIADARNQISELMNQGFTASEALQQTKDGYYESLGALQIRAQLNDLYSHVVADPLNFVMPYLKPIERTKALAYFASSAKWSDEVVDAARVATRALDVEGLSDIQKLTALDKVKQYAKLSGKFIGNRGEKFNKAVEAVDTAKVSKMMRGVIEEVGLNTRERIALNITGGADPFRVASTKLEKFYDKMPWRLTPSARAYEYVTTIQDNVGAYIINAMDNEDDIVNAIIRAATGATGEEMGHAFLTIEGRAVQGALKGFEVEAIELLNKAKAINKFGDKDLLADVAKLAGRSEEELMGIMKGGDFASVAKMTDGVFSPPQLETLFSKLEGMPYTTRLFKFQLMNRLADRSAKTGALMFGVKQRGFVEKLAQAVKSAETLAFLRINPGYMIRNVLNNEVTMIARGAGVGWKDLQDAGKYFDLDFEPFRMSQGFGAIGDTFAHPADVASEALGEILTGETGKMDRFSRWVNDISLGKLDMGKASASMERNASRRAFTTSYIRGWNQYFWKPGVGFDELGKYLPTRIADEIRAYDKGLIQAVEKFVQSSTTPQGLKAKVFTENLNISRQSILDEASATLGYDVTKSMPPEIVASFMDGLEDAAKNGRISSFMTDLRAKYEASMVESSPRIIEGIANDVAVKVANEGPQAFPKILAYYFDESTSLGIYHARSQANIADMARAVSDTNRKLAYEIWERGATQAHTYYTRDFKRMDAVIRGFKKAAGQDEDLIRLADDAAANFAVYRDGWKQWWKSKRAREKAYWKPVLDGKKPKGDWDAIAAVNKEGYDAMIQVEKKAMTDMDNVVARSLPEADRGRYLAGQADLRDYIRRDKEQVSDLFGKMRTATADEREALYQELVTERTQRLEQIRAKQFTVTKALEGDPEAIRKLDDVAATLPKKELRILPYDYAQEKLSRTELPEYVSNEIAREAESLRSSLSGTGVEINLADKTRVSSNPLWYRELYKEGFKSRKSIERALDRIIEGKDIPRANEKVLPRVKEIIIDNLTGTEDVPASPRFLMEFGLEDEAADALRAWMDEGLLAGKTDDEILELLGSDENVERLMAIMNGETPPPRATALPDEAAAEIAPAAGKTYVNDIDPLRKGTDTWLAPEQQAADEWWLTRGYPALDEIEKGAITQASKPEMKWSSMSKESQQYLNNYIEHVSGQMGDARYASTRFAEYGRDAALLNYNRRYNFNTWLGTIMPYEFWTTHSMMKWALHSIDRPAMLSTYLRTQEFMNTAGAPNQALPQRLKGQFRIPMPFLPDWAGDSVFFDPLRTMIPIQNFTQGYEQEMQRMSQLEGKTEYILNDMVENGEIRPEEAETAILEKKGDLWDKAQQMAIDDNEDLAFNSWDFASLLTSPHAPLDWAVKTMEGRPEDIGPFTPASRTIKGVMGLLGVDWDRSPYNMEARVRKQLGLPAFDKWDDYRIDRMLSNMAAMGEIPAQAALRAMIEREGPEYDEAIKKSGKEFGVGAIGSTFGIPAKIYPEGEFLQRSLEDDFRKALEMRDEEGGADALQNFFELHPEYESKLALWKSPEERLRQFLIDDMWSIYNELPKLTKDELKEQLGDEYYTKFVNKETRSYDSIELNELQVWLKLMGGDPPGTLESEPVPIELADPEVAWRAEVFYDTRKVYFPDFYEIQKGYYEIPDEDKAAKKAYKAENPSLEPYWEWRRDWLHRNPEVVPYLDDDLEFEYSSPEAQRRAEEPQPWLTWDEWTQYMGPSMSNLMEDHFVRDYDIPDVLQDRIEELASQIGISYGEALGLMRESIFGQEQPPQIEQQSQLAPQTQSGVNELRVPTAGEAGKQEGLTAYAIQETLYGIKSDPRLTDHAKKFLSSKTKTIVSESKEEGGFTRLGYEQQERDPRAHSDFTVAALDPTGDINTMRHEYAHAIDEFYKVSRSQEFSKLFFPMDTHYNRVSEAIDDPYGRVEKAFEQAMSGAYIPPQQSGEFFAALFAELAANPEDVPEEIRRIYKPYIKFP